MLLRTIILLSTIAVVLAQDILGLTYNFGQNFHEDFNQDKCEASEWGAVEYESLGVAKPFRNAVGARAIVNSCATSFPVILVPDSVLEFVVYMNTVNKHSGVTITVLDENDDELFKYVFDRNNKDFEAGWSRITLPVETNAVAYINLIGRSETNEIVLIDSFYYKIKTNDNYDENSDETNFIFNVKESSTAIESENIDTTAYPDFDDNEGSGSDKLETDEGEEDAILGAWAIALIAVGSVTCVGMIVVGIYQLGKAAGIATYESFPEDLEPSVRIPRVRNVRQFPEEPRTWF